MRQLVDTRWEPWEGRMLLVCVRETIRRIVEDGSWTRTEIQNAGSYAFHEDVIRFLQVDGRLHVRQESRL